MNRPKRKVLVFEARANSIYPTDACLVDVACFDDRSTDSCLGVLCDRCEVVSLSKEHLESARQSWREQSRRFNPTLVRIAIKGKLRSRCLHSILAHGILKST